MKTSATSVMNKIRQGWRSLRTLTGDDAYDRYLEHHCCTRSPLAPLSRKEYFSRAQQGHWEKINRCC